MNRWLYRAAGTVGIAGGFLLLGAGSAQADDTEQTDGLLGDVFSPTSGLPPLDLPGAGTPAASNLTLDPHDGRLGAPELLPALPGGVDSLLKMALEGVPLDAAGLPGGKVGTAGALADGGPLGGDPLGGDPLGYDPLGDDPLGDDPLGGDLLRVDGDPIGLPSGPIDHDAPRRSHPPTGFRTLPAPAPITPDSAAAPTVMSESAAPVGPSGPAEVTGSLPFLTKPVNDTLQPGQSLQGLSTVSALVSQAPVAGPMVNQHLRSLPLVNEMVTSPQKQSAPATGDPLTGPIIGDQLPPLIAQQLAAEHGRSPELLGNGLPFVGDALDPLGHMFGVGNVPRQLPMIGPLAGPFFGALPVVDDSDPAPPAGARPIAGEDHEYTESTHPGL